MSMYHFTDSDAVEHDIDTIPETGDFHMVRIDGRKYWPVDRDRLLVMAGNLRYLSSEMKRIGFSTLSDFFIDASLQISEACGVVDE